MLLFRPNKLLAGVSGPLKVDSLVKKKTAIFAASALNVCLLPQGFFYVVLTFFLFPFALAEVKCRSAQTQVTRRMSAGEA